MRDSRSFDYAPDPLLCTFLIMTCFREGPRPQKDRGSWFVIRGSENPWIVIRDSGIEKAAGTNFFIQVEKLN